jgi:hypothetical protein
MPWQWPFKRHDRALWQVGDIPSSSTYAAVPVSPSTAMQHSAVWACVNLIAGSISTLPLAAYRDGDRTPLATLPPILRAHSAGTNLPDFLYAALQSLLVRGNAYGLIVDRTGAGLLPAQVELLAPERVGVAANGPVEYRVDGQLVDPPPSGTSRRSVSPAASSGCPRSPTPARRLAWAWPPNATGPSSSATRPSPAAS